MTQKQIRQLTGILLVVGAILVNIPYALLISTFDYPDILRASTSDILIQFSEGGSRLIWTWLAFAWVGMPILLAILWLPRALKDEKNSDKGQLVGNVATFFGATSLMAQMIGLLRWPFVVPVLARLYTAPTATEATRDAVAAVFQAVHQYGGVVIGEHIGQSFIILWMVLLSVSMLRQASAPCWLPWTGFVAAGIYALAQGEVLSTVLPGLQYWSEAGLVGSLMWIGWLIALGVVLLRKARTMSYEYTGSHSPRGVGAI